MFPKPVLPEHGPRLIVVGSGGRPYREYSFAALAGRYRVCAVLGAQPGWQRPYLCDHRVVPLDDAAAVAAAVGELAGGHLSQTGLLTWDETVLEVTATAAEKLGMRHMSMAAAQRCRDKYTMRALLAEAGVPSARYRLVHSAAEAVEAGDEFGCPVVVKPRALAGSVGVTFAESAAAVRDAFDLAGRARYATLPAGGGVLVEEYLDGPEISIDSAVFNGTATCVQVARKRLGFPPYFEEVGHLVAGFADQPCAAAVTDLVERAHRVLGIEWGVTHAEVRLTSSGPKMIELNGRLGGDLIPFLGALSNGVDLVLAAAELAFGRRPDLTPRCDRAAEVRFLYPQHDAVLRSLDVRAAATVPGVERVIPLAEPGTRLLLPPRMPLPRIAAVVVTGPDAPSCARSLDQAEAAISWELDPLPAGVR